MRKIVSMRQLRNQVFQRKPAKTYICPGCNVTPGKQWIRGLPMCSESCLIRILLIASPGTIVNCFINGMPPRYRHTCMLEGEND